MSWVQLQNITFAYEGSYENIFTGLTVGFDTDWKLGLIGRNGRGKTTLLRILMGTLKAQGEILSPVRFSGFPIALDMEQPGRLSLREAIAPYGAWEAEMARLLDDGGHDALAAYGEALTLYQEHDGFIIDQLIEREVRLLGVNPEVLGRPLSSLSGGERVKLMLAALFLRRNSFLLIDEPTNHLDMKSRESVAAYLAGKRGYLLVSHDRWFLDETIDHVLSMNKTGMAVEQGNYSTWRENKRRADAYEAEKNQRLQKEIAVMEESLREKRMWSDSIEAGKIGSHAADRGAIGHLSARMMKRAMSIQTRQKRAIDEKKELLHDIEYAPQLKLRQAEHFRSRLITALGLSVSYGAREIFSGLELTLDQGDRLALTGPNGCGKTSVFKAILGTLEEGVLGGSLRIAPHIDISYVSQETRHLRGPLMAFANQAGRDTTLFLTILRKLDFRRFDFEKDLDRLSDGQMKKVLISSALCGQSHLLLWDEPLNFIDVYSREQIEELILEYQPTMLFIEHDKRFIEHIATGVVDMAKR